MERKRDEEEDFANGIYSVNSSRTSSVKVLVDGCGGRQRN